MDEVILILISTTIGTRSLLTPLESRSRFFTIEDLSTCDEGV
jgi:hypothetical protein